jgi:hypothetical protein
LRSRPNSYQQILEPPPTNTETLSVPPAVNDSTIPVDTTEPDRLAPVDAPSSPTNVMRVIRSPSKHRYYGQAAEGSSAPHSPSAVMSSDPVLDEEDTDDEKEDVKKSDLTMLQVDESLKLPSPRTPPRTPNYVEAPAPQRERSRSPIKVVTSATRKPRDAAAGGVASPTSPNRHVPMIRIQIPSSADSERSSDNTPPPYDHTPLMGEVQSQEGRSSPRRSTSGRRDSISGIRVVSPPAPSSPSDEQMPSRIFEAFPTLHGNHWFTSVKLAVVSCVVTSTMIVGTIIYNIVQAVHNSGQTASA